MQTTGVRRMSSKGSAVGTRGAVLLACMTLAVAVAAACNTVENVIGGSTSDCADVSIADVSVAVGLGQVNPDDITITAGDVVCFETLDQEDHRLESRQTLSVGGFLFDGGPLIDSVFEVGTWSYFCAIHEADGELGMITILP